MPEGEIESYDPEEQHGLIAPDDDSDPLPFTLDDVVDHHIGERITEGDRVVFDEDEDEGAAVNVRRLSTRGYG
jgi:cold shock CspA family protein